MNVVRNIYVFNIGEGGFDMDFFFLLGLMVSEFVLFLGILLKEEKP